MHDRGVRPGINFFLKLLKMNFCTDRRLRSVIIGDEAGSLINRHEVQAESKIFRSRIAGKSSYPYWGTGNKVVIVRWFYIGRHMKELLTAGRVTENGAYKQTSMESNIVDTMRSSFKNDKGKMGNLELSIIASVKRYFEEPPPKRPV